VGSEERHGGETNAGWNLAPRKIAAKTIAGQKPQQGNYRGKYHV